jgi:hypothetical protein
MWRHDIHSFLDFVVMNRLPTTLHDILTVICMPGGLPDDGTASRDRPRVCGHMD